MALSVARLRSRAVTRSADEPDRSATMLEALLDLVYVVAVARSVAVLHDLLAEGRNARALVSFALTFWALWWSWVGFTWYANAHDGDQVTDRLLLFVQMLGALVFAAGVHRAGVDRDFTVVVIGYVIARIGLVAGWLRVARDRPAERPRAVRSAMGIAGVQVLWVGWLAVPDRLAVATFVVLAALELAAPYWAARGAGDLVMHAGHIDERYGLFTIILLGESVAAAVAGFQAEFDVDGPTAPLLVLAGCSAVIAFCCWWLYFDHPGHLRPTERTAFRWGELHLIVFVALATLGAGLATGFEVQADAAVHASARVATLSIGVPVALFLVGLAVLMAVNGVGPGDVRILPKLVGAAVVLLAAATLPVIATVAVATAVLLVLVAWMVLEEPPEADGDRAALSRRG